MGWEKTPDSDAKEELETGIVAVENIEEPAPTKKPQKNTITPVLYINNIKIFLTHLVIVYHVALVSIGGSVAIVLAPDTIGAGSIALTVFSSLNKSYFMSCFFFYSGYFSPKSYDKKGAYVFLFERIKRLGIPYSIYNFIIGPYVIPSIGGSLLTDSGPSTYSFTKSDVTWFLASLIEMNLFYALLCGANWFPKVPFPGIPNLLLFGFILGIAVNTVTQFVKMASHHILEHFFSG